MLQLIHFLAAHVFNCDFLAPVIRWNFCFVFSCFADLLLMLQASRGSRSEFFFIRKAQMLRLLRKNRSICLKTGAFVITNAPVVNRSIYKMLKCSYDVCYALNTEHLGPKQPEHLRFFLLVHPSFSGASKKPEISTSLSIYDLPVCSVHPFLPYQISATSTYPNSFNLLSNTQTQNSKPHQN